MIYHNSYYQYKHNYVALTSKLWEPMELCKLGLGRPFNFLKIGLPNPNLHKTIQTFIFITVVLDTA